MAIAVPPSSPWRHPFADEDGFYYPESDGMPMAESDLHADVMVYCKVALRHHFADQPEVYVSGNNFIYFEQGNPQAVVSPDCYVVFGVGMRFRDTYQVWKEGGKLPDVVIEITSKKTRKEDVRKKVPLYEKMGVGEYIQFDPTGDYLKPALQGRKLVNGKYEPMPLVNNRLTSEMLGLEIVWQGQELRFYDPLKEEWLLSPEEWTEKAEELAFLTEQLTTQTEDLTTQVEEERQKSEALTAQIEEERQQAEEAKRQAEVEAQRAEQEAIRAQSQAERADTAEAEIARLRAELEALRRTAGE